MKSVKTIVALSIIVLMAAASPFAFAQAAHVRWDIINVTPGPTVNPGGQASAMDNVGDTITSTWHRTRL